MSKARLSRLSTPCAPYPGYQQQPNCPLSRRPGDRPEGSAGGRRCRKRDCRGSQRPARRTQDTNSNQIARYLAGLGIDLKEVRVVGDVESEIVAALNALRAVPRIPTATKLPAISPASGST